MYVTGMGNRLSKPMIARSRRKEEEEEEQQQQQQRQHDDDYDYENSTACFKCAYHTLHKIHDGA